MAVKSWNVGKKVYKKTPLKDPRNPSVIPGRYSTRWGKFQFTVDLIITDQIKKLYLEYLFDSLDCSDPAPSRMEHRRENAVRFEGMVNLKKHCKEQLG